VLRKSKQVNKTQIVKIIITKTKIVRTRSWQKMRSWVKALLISAMTLLLVIIFLPSLAKPALNNLLPWALEKSNLEEIEFSIDSLSWYQLTLKNVSFSNPKTSANTLESFSLQDLSISYSPFKLLSGKVNSIEVDQVVLVMTDKIATKNKGLTHKALEDKNLASKESKTDAEVLSEEAIILPNAKEIFARLPADKIHIKKLSISHPTINIIAQVEIDKKNLKILSTVNLTALNQSLNHQLSFNNQGTLLTQINQQNSSEPIFILQGEWLEKKNKENNKSMLLSLQQSADIQTWISLINNKEVSSRLLAKTAIQAWSQEVISPKQINNSNQFFQDLSGEGLLQIKINDFSIQSPSKKTSDNNTAATLSQADLLFNATTRFNHTDEKKQKKLWQLVVDNFDLKGTTHAIDELAIHLQQHLSKPLNINCAISDNTNIECLWEGTVQQSLKADNLSSEFTMKISGDFSDTLASGSVINFRQMLNMNIEQNNERWPRLNNKTFGEFVFNAQKNPQVTGDDFWHWQLNLPFGLNNETDYFEQLPTALAAGELSRINWQVLPDWQLQGINGELTNAKALSVLINDLSWAETRKSFKSVNRSSKTHKSLRLEQATLSCSFDWLKLQYSPQLRSNEALKDLPLECEWKANNSASHWEQWPIPALEMTGLFQLNSLNFEENKMRAEAKLIGLNQHLDLTLHAQHDFSGLQEGAAQLYLNNLNLDWAELGLIEMLDLTQAQLLGGTLSAQGWIKWQQYQEDIFDDESISWRWQPDIMLRADDLAGIYNTTTAWDDVDFQMAVRRPFYQDFKVVSQVSANSVNPGINVSNILARSTTTIEPDFSNALIVIEEIHSDVLGGRVKVPLIRFDTSQEINSFGIEVEGIQISQLAELEAGSGIAATGTLDGVLPIILLPEGPQVPAGSLYARAPGGIINYRNDVASTLKNSDPSVGLAMQVLDDFHYDQLQTDITYQPNGELRLGLQFQGKNPTFFNGQATHLNLNLDYNLLDLLESLRISNDIVQKLENKYQ
jgi:hypothetical protein